MYQQHYKGRDTNAQTPPPPFPPNSPFPLLLLDLPLKFLTVWVSSKDMDQYFTDNFDSDVRYVDS